MSFPTNNSTCLFSEEEISKQEAYQAKGSYDLERYSLGILDPMRNIVNCLITSLTLCYFSHPNPTFLCIVGNSGLCFCELHLHLVVWHRCGILKFCGYRRWSRVESRVLRITKGFCILWLVLKSRYGPWVRGTGIWSEGFGGRRPVAIGWRCNRCLAILMLESKLNR